MVSGGTSTGPGGVVGRVLGTMYVSNACRFTGTKYKATTVSGHVMISHYMYCGVSAEVQLGIGGEVCALVSSRLPELTLFPPDIHWGRKTYVHDATHHEGYRHITIREKY